MDDVHYQSFGGDNSPGRKAYHPSTDLIGGSSSRRYPQRFFFMGISILIALGAVLAFVLLLPREVNVTPIYNMQVSGLLFNVSDYSVTFDYLIQFDVHNQNYVSVNFESAYILFTFVSEPNLTDCFGARRGNSRLLTTNLDDILDEISSDDGSQSSTNFSPISPNLDLDFPSCILPIGTYAIPIASSLSSRGVNHFSFNNTYYIELDTEAYLGLSDMVAISCPSFINPPNPGKNVGYNITVVGLIRLEYLGIQVDQMLETRNVHADCVNQSSVDNININR